MATVPVSDNPPRPEKDNEGGLRGVASVEEVTIYSHSPILYWWPVWVLGLAMALWTAIDNQHLVVVPEHTVVAGNVLTAPEGTVLEQPVVHMAQSRWPGIVFVFALLLSFLVSTTSVRGPWALFGISLVVAVVLLFNWLELWDPLYRWFNLLRLHLNLGAYLVLSVGIFIPWAISFFFFDRRTYLIFSTGQVRIREEIGEGEKVFDTGGVSFEKKQYDWLRLLLGFGAGDMLIRVGGPSSTIYEVQNVIRLGHKLQMIEERLRTHDVV